MPAITMERERQSCRRSEAARPVIDPGIDRRASELDDMLHQARRGLEIIKADSPDIWSIAAFLFCAAFVLITGFFIVGGGA